MIDVINQRKKLVQLSCVIYLATCLIEKKREREKKEEFVSISIYRQPQKVKHLIVQVYACGFFLCCISLSFIYTHHNEKKVKIRIKKSYIEINRYIYICIVFFSF